MEFVEYIFHILITQLLFKTNQIYFFFKYFLLVDYNTSEVWTMQSDRGLFQVMYSMHFKLYWTYSSFNVLRILGSWIIPSDIPFVIQRDVLVCEQSNSWNVNLQICITAFGRRFLWRIRTHNTFVRRHSILMLHRNNVTLFWLHAEMYPGV